MQTANIALTLPFCIEFEQMDILRLQELDACTSFKLHIAIVLLTMADIQQQALIFNAYNYDYYVATFL